MKVLAIRQPWASLIAEGYKNVEVRSRNTNIREKIAIYASRSSIKQHDLEIAEQYIPCMDIPQGALIATADLVDSISWTHFSFSHYFEEHRIPEDYPQIGNYGWVLANIQKIKPIPFKMPLGSVIWTNTELLDLQFLHP